MRILLTLLIATGGAPSGVGPATQGHGPLAVVVNPKSAVANLSIEDLRRLFLGTTTMLPDRDRVVLLEFRPDRNRFYQASLGMNEDRVKRHWIRRVFAGEVGAPPDEYRDVEELIHFVATHPGAIAFLPANAVTSDVKVLSINGKKPGEAGYPLQ